MTTDATPDTGTLTEAERADVRWVLRHWHPDYDEDSRAYEVVTRIKADAYAAGRAAAAPAHDGLRAAVLREAADAMAARLDTFPQRGRHTRARWAEAWLRMEADRAALSTAPARDTGDSGRDRETVERVRALADEWIDAAADGECPDGYCGACSRAQAGQELSDALDGTGADREPT